MAEVVVGELRNHATCRSGSRVFRTSLEARSEVEKKQPTYQKRAYFSGIKIFNNLPLEIKNVADNQKKFKTALKKFLYTYSFYTLEEYFSQL